MSSIGSILMHLFVVLAGAAFVWYGSFRLAQIKLLEAQQKDPNGKKYCPTNGVSLTSGSNKFGQAFLYGGFSLIAVTFILKLINGDGDDGGSTSFFSRYSR